MAREETTVEDLEKLARALSGVSGAVDSMIKQMKENDVPSVRLHLAMLTKRLLPQLEHWADIAQLHSRDDVRSYLAGIESPSAAQRRYNENRKLASAKKSKADAKKVPRSSQKKT